MDIVRLTRGGSLAFYLPIISRTKRLAPLTFLQKHPKQLSSLILTQNAPLPCLVIGLVVTTLAVRVPFLDLSYRSKY